MGWRSEERETVNSKIIPSDLSLQVSMWPMVATVSSNFADMFKNGYFVKNSTGAQTPFVGLYIYDPFNPDARKFVFDRLVAGYVSNGIKVSS